MAQFRATIQGGRGEAARLGHKTTGIEANVNGWDSGVKVSGYHTDDADKFDIYMTTGSSGDGRELYLGTVKITEEGPVFVGGNALEVSTGGLKIEAVLKTR